jgi:hypothetical protein
MGASAKNYHVTLSLGTYLPDECTFDHVIVSLTTRRACIIYL